MGLFDFFFPKRPSSASVARERLQIVLAHERASRGGPDFLAGLQRELLDVVKKYVEIRDDMIRVNVGKSGETSVLEINIEIEGAKQRPLAASPGAGNGARPAPPPPPRPGAAAPKPAKSSRA